VILVVLAIACFADDFAKAPKGSKSPRVSKTPPGVKSPRKPPVTPTTWSTDPKCRLCVDAITALENAVFKNSTVPYLTNLVNTICDRFKLRSWCVANIDKKIPYLIPLLRLKINPYKLCSLTNISFCKPNRTNEGSDLIEQIDEVEQVDEVDEELAPPPPPPRPPRVTPSSWSTDPKCRLCIDGMSALENAVKKNSTVAALQAVLDKVCDRFKLKSWCQATLDKKLLALIPSLKMKVNPLKICQSANISLCKNKTNVDEIETVEETVDEIAEEEMSEEQKRGFNLKCEACAAVISAVKSTISGKIDANSLSAAVGRVCGKIPFASDVCKSIIGSQVQNVVDGLNNKLDSKGICKKIKACK
jgi:hypothetical protein